MSHFGLTSCQCVYYNATAVKTPINSQLRLWGRPLLIKKCRNSACTSGSFPIISKLCVAQWAKILKISAILGKP